MGFLGQYCTILCTIIRLKSWRFLWLVIFGASAMSNHFLYNSVGSWVANFGMQGFQQISGKDFAQNSAIVGQTKKFAHQFSILTALIDEQAKGAKAYAIEDCGQSADPNACNMHLLSLMISQTANKYSHYVEFSDNTKGQGQPRIVCNIAFGSETYCPFLAGLVNTASYGTKKANHRFKNVTAFRYVTKSSKSAARIVQSAGKTLCAMDPEYLNVMPRTVILQAFLLLCTIFIYLLASTVPCICDLKSRGFLQLMFRRGLSVLAYWLALWTLTLIELLVPAGLVAVSHHIQCPGFYDTFRLIYLVIVCAIQAYSVASLIFFLTVIIQKQFAIGMAALLLAFGCCAVVALSLILLHWLQSTEWTRYVLTWLPPGMMGDQLQAVLVSQMRPEAATLYHSLLLVMSIWVWVFFLLLAVYLDYWVRSGSGLFEGAPHFPCAVLCGRMRKQRPEETREPPSLTVEPVDGLTPMVQIRELRKEFAPCCPCRKGNVALDNVSVTLYQNQLTAFVGHNGSGKSTLLNVLTGKSVPSSGNVCILGYRMDSVRARYELVQSIGVCYQHDALCGGITVANSIRLIQSASGAPSNKVELDHALTKLGLKESLGRRVCNLSSGQKRKLCTLLAILGNPRVIILDEPTSNLDPVSRRQLWKLLQEYRFGRCIILTTSLMEEADLLADRKIFMSGGSIIFAGSSLFLRRAFDCGFIFQTKVKTERHVCWVLRAVNRHFQRVRARSIYRSNIELELSAADDHLLPGVAEVLEKLTDLVEGFEIAQFSLEQIFSRLRSMSSKDIEQLFRTGEIAYTVDASEELALTQAPRKRNSLLPMGSRRYAEHSPSLSSRVAALIAICFKRTIRKGSTIFSRIIFPVLLLLLLVVSLIGEKTTKSSRLDLWEDLVERHTQDVNFTKGVCIDDDDMVMIVDGAMHRHAAHSSLCKQFMTRDKNSSEEAFYFASKRQKVNMHSFLINSVEKNVAFRRICTMDVAKYEPCAVMFANNWCEDKVENVEREISLGFYSLYNHFNIQLATKYLLWIYARALASFNPILAPNITMWAQVTGVKEFRTTFIPLFGLFFQMMILCIIPATYLDDLMEHKVRGVRSQLLTLGMSSGHYWIGVFIAHWIQYSVVYTLSMILVFFIDPGSYFNGSFVFFVFLPTLFLGLTSNLLLVYYLATIFEKQSIVLTVVFAIVSLALGQLLLLAQLDNFMALVAIFAFPPVATVALTFYGGKLIIYSMAFMKAEKVSELASPLSIMTMSLHMKMAFAAMAVHIILLALGIFILERWQQKRCCGCCCGPRKGMGDPVCQTDDLGVLEETSRLDEHPQDNRNLLEVRHLRILAPDGKKLVRDVSFAVKPGEIFGLLGPNGSGKTTVVSAIAGHLELHWGECEVQDDKVWLPSHKAALAGNIGYCQSSDPLLSYITVAEHLNFYAAAFGVPGDRSQAVVEELLSVLHLADIRDQLISKLSKGSKRRLSMAISLIGNPSIVVIDDPSEGVDPDGRRLIWAAIQSIASENRAVVATMHAMDEVVGTCTRVGIMNHGQLVGIGSMDQILNHFGQVYTLSIKLKENGSDSSEFRQLRIGALIKAIEAKFHDAYVVEQMSTSVLVCVPASNIGRLSDVLRWLVDHKKSLDMELFSIRRVYLDEVFQLIIKNHDDKLLRRKYSIFSMAESVPANLMSDDGLRSKGAHA